MINDENFHTCFILMLLFSREEEEEEDEEEEDEEEEDEDIASNEKSLEYNKTRVHRSTRKRSREQVLLQVQYHQREKRKSVLNNSNISSI